MFYSHRSGDWDTPGTWSNVSNDPSSPDASTLPTINNAVVIGDGLTNNHVVIISTNGKSTGTLQISGGSILDLKATTGHNFIVLPDQRVRGTGIIRIASGNFPIRVISDSSWDHMEVLLSIILKQLPLTLELHLPSLLPIFQVERLLTLQTIVT